MLTALQSQALEGLRRQSSHPVEVVEEPAEGSGVVTLLVSFPGLYLTLSESGETLQTRTAKQWAKDQEALLAQRYEKELMRLEL